MRIQWLKYRSIKNHGPQKRWMTNPNYPTIRKISAEFPITKISEWPFQSSTGQHSFQSRKRQHSWPGFLMMEKNRSMAECHGFCGKPIWVPQNGWWKSWKTPLFFKGWKMGGKTPLFLETQIWTPRWPFQWVFLRALPGSGNFPRNCWKDQFPGFNLPVNEGQPGQPHLLNPKVGMSNTTTDSNTASGKHRDME